MTRLLVAATLSLSFVCAAAAPQTTEPIRVQSAFVRVLEEAEIPAREAGALTVMEVREGDRVAAGQVVGQLDDDDAKIAVARAELDLAIAEKQARNDLPVRTAEAARREAEHNRQQVEMANRIAGRKAENDVSVRHAVKSRDASKSELDRAAQSRKTFAASVSQAEIDRLKLIVERNDLEIEKAEFDRELAALQKRAEDSSIAEQDQAVERLKLAVEQARLQKDIDALSRDVKSRALDFAQAQAQKRRLRSPLDGVVAEVFRQRGEWLEPGQRVLRVVRLDRLRVEGFIDSRKVRGDLRGAPVRVDVEVAEGESVTVRGRIAFVSPEVNPVNGEVRVWAEVDNPDQTLHPGMKADMQFEPATKPADKLK